MTPPPDYVQKHILKHTYALISWALVSLVIGGTGMFYSVGVLHHFLHMNAAWGSVNLLVGLVLWYTTKHLNLLRSTTFRLHQFRRLLYLNVILDSIYLIAGWWLLKEVQGSGVYADYFIGFGYGVLLQGAVLLLFDLVSIGILHRYSMVPPYPTTEHL